MHFRNNGFATLLLIVILTASAAGSDSRVADIVGAERELTPSEFHTILGQLKAYQMENSRVARQAAAAWEASAFDPYAIDALYYDVSIGVDIPSELIYGNVRNVYRSTVDGLDTVEIDFDAVLTVDSIYNGSGRLNFSHAGMRLTIELDRAYDQNEVISFNVVYHGHPVEGGFQAFAFSNRYDGTATVPVVSSLSEPYYARTWWPCKDRPDDKADSMDIHITNDAAYYCASNGTLLGIIDNGNGTKTFNYRVRYPIATYLFSIGISNYIVWKNYYKYSPTDSMEVVHHVYPDKLTTSQLNYSVTPGAIAIYSNIFGQYPFLSEKYGHTNFEWGGGMEHQTNTSMTGTWFGFYEPTIIHELGHQWWGDMITCESWHDIWLNEGFASYCEALYYETTEGIESYHDYMAGMNYTGSRTIYVYDTTSTSEIFNIVVYDKGAWLVHMLRHVVGDEDFFEILQTYYNSSAQYGSASTGYFIDLCEGVSGEELTPFFDDWLYGRYRPNYLFEKFIEYDADLAKWVTYLRLRQAQTTEPLVFSMPIDFVLTYASAQLDTVVIDSDTRDTIYTILTDEQPVSIALDPDNWILKTQTEASWKIHFIPTALDTGYAYEPYNHEFVAKGGSGQFKFLVTSGSLPTGLTLDSLTGVISGYPEQSGNIVFSVKAQDYNNAAANETKEFTITINPPLYAPGDLNQDGNVNLLDILGLIGVIYEEAPEPADPNLGDVDHSCNLNLLDILYLIDFIYGEGTDPLMGCVMPW